MKRLTFLALLFAASVASGQTGQAFSEQKAATEKNPPDLTISFVDYTTSQGAALVLQPPCTSSGPPTWRALCKETMEALGVSLSLTRHPAISSAYTFVVNSGVLRSVPVGALRGGRGGFSCFSEGFRNTSTTLLDCSVQDSREGTGTGTAVASSSANHPGVQTCSSGTDTTGGCAFQTGGQGTTAVASVATIFLGNGAASSFVNGKLTTAISDGTETYTAWVGGWTNGVFTTVGAKTAPPDGVFFRYTHSVNGGKWQGVVRNTGADTATCDTTSAADTNFHSFEIIVNAAGTAEDFYIDGSLACSCAAAVSSNGVTPTPIAIIKSAGTTARLVSLDAFGYTHDFTTPR